MQALLHGKRAADSVLGRCGIALVPDVDQPYYFLQSSIEAYLIIAAPHF